MGKKRRTTPSNDIPKDFPDDETVFMLSFLQWNEQAKYPEGSSHPPCSGEEAWVGSQLVKFSNIEIFQNTLGSDNYSLTILEHLDAALRKWKLVFFTSPKARCNEDVGYRPRKFCSAMSLCY
ncbi:hypothetical protein BDV12DRAFT_191703 [Aspergillus spectabilis]